MEKKINLDPNKATTTLKQQKKQRGWSYFSSFHQQFIMRKKGNRVEEFHIYVTYLTFD